MNRYIFVLAGIVLFSSCAQKPVRPNPEDIEGMNVTSIKGQIDYGYSLEELWLLKERGKISMAGSGAVKNGIYDYQEGITLQEFIALAGGYSKCPSNRIIGVKRILENNFFAIGNVPLDGEVKSGDTVYVNCLAKHKTAE